MPKCLLLIHPLIKLKYFLSSESLKWFSLKSILSDIMMPIPISFLIPFAGILLLILSLQGESPIYKQRWVSSRQKNGFCFLMHSASLCWRFEATNVCPLHFKLYLCLFSFRVFSLCLFLYLFWSIVSSILTEVIGGIWIY